MKMKTSRGIAIAGLAGLSLAWVAWAAATPPGAGQEERAAIADKTQGERDQLQRRFKEFGRLSKAERAEILRIHGSVESNPELAETLEDYTKFVAGLEPWERDQLEEETDPARRVAAVGRLIEAKNGRRNDARHPGWMTGETVRGTTFRPDDFQEILEQRLAMLEDAGTTAAKPGTIEWQHWAVEQLAAKWRSDDFQSWPSAEATKEVVKKIPHDRFREFLLKNDRVDDGKRREIVAALLARTLMAEWQREIPDRVPKEEIRAALLSFKDRRQREWMWHDPGRLQAAVIEVLERKPGDIGEFAEEYGKVRELYFEFDDWADRDRRGDRDGERRRGEDGGHRRDGDDHHRRERHSDSEQ